MVDTLKRCCFVGNSGDIALEFVSSTGADKSVVISPLSILELMVEIKKVTQEANDKARNVDDRNGAISSPTYCKLYQYQFMCAKDMSHLVLHFLTKDNTNFSFPLTKNYAKRIGEELIACAEYLKREDKADKLKLV